MTSNYKLADFTQWCVPPVEDAWFLTGPTASGKTAVSLDLAREINAEIISMDSMAIYRDMDIGTAKPSSEERNVVEHHMIDVVAPTDDYSLSQYVMAAHRKVAEIKSRGRQVLFVGGTPLYLKSLLRGMFLGPEPDQEFRDAIEDDVEAFGIEVLRNRLRSVDPLSAHKILPNDKRRMIRALEVARATGIPMSHWQTQFERVAQGREQRVFAMSWLRGDLHKRVEQRVSGMLERGLLDEVEFLLEKYNQLSKTASQAVGYKEPIAYLKGEISKAQMNEQVVFHTRQFVRRQEMWLRSLQEVQSIKIDCKASLATASHRILSLQE